MVDVGEVDQEKSINQNDDLNSVPIVRYLCPNGACRDENSREKLFVSPGNCPGCGRQLAKVDYLVPR